MRFKPSGVTAQCRINPGDVTSHTTVFLAFTVTLVCKRTYDVLLYYKVICDFVCMSTYLYVCMCVCQKNSTYNC